MIGEISKMIVIIWIMTCFAFLSVAIGKTTLGLSKGIITDELKAERNELYFKALKELDFDAVKQDIIALIHSSDPAWPSDYGNYGPFFIRMAWHCAGTYRSSDGEGGCDGGRQRFDPERSWADNTNLDKARSLLFPIKQKYGLGLSWGDLIILTGSLSIKEMGGPFLGFCAGRADDLTGFESVILGPNDAQEETAPCPVNGNCSEPLGAILLEHIYIDPNGFLGDPDPVKSVEPTRSIFARMGMNDSETVALIGGGHTFGKTHGACPAGAGPSPKEQPENPWPGNCGDGKGVNTFTAGFEGPWTATPTEWDNKFFEGLVNLDFELFEGPGGHNQNRVPLDAPFRPQAPNVDLVGTQDIMMLVTDIALTKDSSFLEIVQSFANDFELMTNSFSHAWYKLVTRDMGPVSRCFGPDVPEAQEFQGPLPESNGYDFSAIKDGAEKMLDGEITGFDASEESDQEGLNAGLLIETAYLCAATHRVTDNHGGCNGARIRLEPEKLWEDRAPVESVVDDYVAIADATNGRVSVADLIVLGGTLALQSSTNKVDFEFCPGRVDADSAPTSDKLELFRYDSKILEQERQARLFDLTELEYVALQGRPRSAAYMRSLGYQGSYTDSTKLSNVFAKTLLSETWTRVPGTEDLFFGEEFVNEDGTKFITFYDFSLLLDDAFLSALFELAADEQFFLEVFAKSWTKLMNADRFDGPVENECTNGKIRTQNLGSSKPSSAFVGKKLAMGATLAAAAIGMIAN